MINCFGVRCTPDLRYLATGHVFDRKPVIGSVPAVLKKLHQMSAGDGTLGLSDLGRCKRIGLALVFGSCISLFLPLSFGLPVILYFVLSVIGLLLYAKAKQRRLWWSGMALFPVLGPLIGLRILSWKPKTPESIDFRSGSIVSILISVIAIGITAPWLVELAASINLPDDQWYPQHRLGGEALFFIMPLFILIIPGAFLSHLNRYEFAKTRKLRPFLIVEGVFAGLFLMSYFAAFLVGSMVQEVYEVHMETVLSRLEIGMSRHDVETLILEANASSVKPPGNGAFSTTEKHEDDLYYRLQSALQTARRGELADFSASRQRRFLQPILNDDNHSTQQFRRTHFLGIFHDVSYELLVKYENGRLDWGRYVEQAYYDGPGPCRVVYIGDPETTWTSELCYKPIEYGEWNTAHR